MAQRLLIVAHAATPATLALVFGEPRRPTPGRSPAAERASRVLGQAGRRRRVRRLRYSLGGKPEPIQELRECDFGAWTGRALTDIATDDPSELEAWLHDP